MTDVAHLGDDLPAGHGALGLLSGDEFLPEAAPFDRALLAAAPGPRIGLILCADHRARPHSAQLARAHFASLGAEVLDDDVIHGSTHPDLDLVYIGGGSPSDLVACLGHAPAWREILERWAGGLGLCGSSAGAMVLCEKTLLPTPGASVPTEWSDGLGPVRGVGLAVHASSRPGWWLDQVAATAPVALLALDDHTGVIIDRNGSVTVHGPGGVRFVGR